MSRRDIEQAVALEHQGQIDKAIAIYQGLLRQRPHDAELLSLLGLALARQGQTRLAIPHLQQARAYRPADPSASFNLGVAFLFEGEHDKARDCFADALRLDAGFLPAKANLAALYLGEGRAAEALPLIDDLIARGRPSASSWVNRGIALDLLQRPIEACTAFERAVSIGGDDPQTLVYLGRAYAAAGEMARSRATFERVLERHPGHLEALLRHAMSQLEVVYLTVDEIRRARQGYEDAMERVIATGAEAMARVPLAQLQRMFDWPFLLPYQGEPVKESLAGLGRLVCDLGETWSPSAPALVTPRHERLRLGVATAFFWRHSVWKVPTRGWLKMLDRTRFEVVGYHLSPRTDSETERAKTLCDRFRAGEKDLGGWARQIAEDQLDCLLYPEIGMDRPTILLAAMRLAPLQATTWGHPVTSGLRSIDWYFSSDLMEPPDGDDHYSEKLIRLANLSVFYDTPDERPPTLDRQRLGIGPDRLVYLCCQNLSKYLPQNDGLFIDIVRAVPEALFVFVRSGKPAVDSRFEQRLRAALAAAGLQLETHIRFVEPLSQDEFPSLGAIADVYLDSPEWSGCNTTLELLASNLPIVTCRGRFMRGRHTAAMLQRMGLEAHIATSTKDYVARAIELGHSAALRTAWGHDIGERKLRLFGDKSPVEDLEKLLLRHCGRS